MAACRTGVELIVARVFLGMAEVTILFITRKINVKENFKFKFV